ncbi:YciI family protein [Actinomycetes bacterium KLBMP 9797]
MKYMMLIYGSATEDAAATEGPSMEDWFVYDKSAREAGIVVAGHALQDLTTATSVRVTKEGERVVTDGPFAETREMLGGYYVLDVPNLDVALDWAARCPGARVGTIEVRPIAEFD